MSRLLYRFLAQLARLAVRSGRSKNLQIIVLRYENTILRCQVGRPALTDEDRTLLGAIAAALPTGRSVGVSPSIPVGACPVGRRPSLRRPGARHPRLLVAG